MRSIVCALLLAAAPLHASVSPRSSCDVPVVFDFDPPSGDTRTAVTMTIHGIAGDASGAPIGVVSVAVSGRTVNVHLRSLDYYGMGIISVEVPWATTVHLPLLASGVYDVATYFDDAPDSPPLHASLIIRDREVVVPLRNAIPIGGGTNAFFLLHGPADEYQPRDRVDSISMDGGTTWIKLLSNAPTPMPPHTAGTVDIIAKTAYRHAITAAAAMTYYDPAAPRDPALFEPLLFPASYRGAGANGAQWTTTNTLRSSLDGTTVLPNTGSAAGDIAWALRSWPWGGSWPSYDASCYVANQTSGVASPLPVLRWKDLVPLQYGQSIDFLDVPHPPHAHVVLRVWLFTHAPQTSVGIRINDSVATYYPLTPAGDGLPHFAAIDLTRSIGDAVSPVRVSVYKFALDDAYDGRVWLLLTITDDETGRVTVVPR